VTAAAIIFMSLSVLGVTALAGWCYYNVLKPPRRDGQEDREQE